MSGRAVRRALQRQREAELLKAQQAPSAEPSDAEELDSEPPAAAPKQSLFALLNQDNDDDDDDEDEPLSDHESDEDDTPAPVVTKPAPKAKSSKKKKKKKAKEKAAASKEEEESEDEIDRALRQLNLTSPAAEGEGEGKAAEKKQIELSLPDVLKVDAKNLDAGNEMRRLFGRDAMRGERAEEPAAPRGARGRGRAGQGRPMPTGRKNPLVQPKEEWPNVGSGGLAMEVVIGSETAEDLRDEANGVVEYRFIHSRHYQDVQRQFMMCVEAMDPQRMILLHQHNPYHVTTLLQCSEIFHHQRDFNVSGDLLERALFTMGRCLHSTFFTNLSAGKSRISFRRPENRELFLCCWRYIKNLSQRGTWKTAAEFGFLLFSLDPTGDPYGMSLLLDFLCLKARESQRLLDIIEHPTLRRNFSDHPNIAFSAAIAYHQLEEPEVAREVLAKAITKFPWIPGMIMKELNLDFDPPKALWGVLPPDDNLRQQIYAQLYVERNKDLWKDPALASLLRDTAETIHSLPRKSALASAPMEVSVPLARHLILSEVEPLIRLIPSEIAASHKTTAFDPLIPQDNLESYNAAPENMGAAARAMGAGAVTGGFEDEGAFRTFLRSLMPWFRAPEAVPVDERERLAMLRRELEAAGVDIEGYMEEERRAMEAEEGAEAEREGEREER